MVHDICVMAGDGIGPEVTEQARNVLDCTAELFGFSLQYSPVLMGGASIEAYGVPLTDEALHCARQSEAVLLGAIGSDPKTSPWYRLPPQLRPEAGLLKLRKAMGLFANLRPAYLYPELTDACPLKKEICPAGFDILVVRELTGGIYFGKRDTQQTDAGRYAYDTLEYNEEEIRRIARRAFEIAGSRRGLVTSVDKANVLDTSRLWRLVTQEVASDYPGVTLEHMLVDNCAMQLIRNPARFDVILTENMFGDILSDEASMLTGSIGMLPSASLNETRCGLYEPCHGAAPDLAGTDSANPIAAILSAAMMLRYSLKEPQAADAVEKAVAGVLRDGFRTADIHTEGFTLVGTREMGNLVCGRIQERLGVLAAPRSVRSTFL